MARKTNKNIVSNEMINIIPKNISGKFIGAHVSGAGGLFNCFYANQRIGGESLAIFLKNQRKWTSPPIKTEDIKKFKKLMKDSGLKDGMILPHGSYLINLGNPDVEKREKSYVSFVDDLQRCNTLGIDRYNFHPGSTIGKCLKEESIKFIAGYINRAHVDVPNVCIVLENMSGQKNIIGSKFEDLFDIIELVNDKSRVGVCLDTCHLFAAGYDIRTKDAYEQTMAEFDKIIGFKYLKGVHVNDCKSELGSGLDRHENIGKGKIGINCFKYLMNDDRFNNVPMVLETPASDELCDEIYSQEISLLKSFE